jgi:gas vesicle protein
MTHMTSDRQAPNAMGMVILAAAAGALAALLLAPKKGTELQEDIRGRMNNMKNKAQNKMEDTREKVGDGIETARSKAHDVADKAKSTVSSTADKTKDAADRMSGRADDMTSGSNNDNPMADVDKAAEKVTRSRAQTSRSDSK